MPIGAFTAVLMIFATVPDRRVLKFETEGMKNIFPKLDLPGFCIFAPAAIMVLLGLQWGGDKFAWKSPTIIGLLIGGILTFVVFFLWEAKVGDDKAMIPLSLIGKRQIWSSSVVMLCMMVSIFIATYYLPLYFQSVKGASPLQSGVDTLPSMFSQLIFAVLSGVLGKFLSRSPKISSYLLTSTQYKELVTIFPSRFSARSLFLLAAVSGLLSTSTPR